MLITGFLVFTSLNFIQAQSVIINGDFSDGLNNWTVVQPTNNNPQNGILAQIQFAGELNVSEAFSVHVGNNSPQSLEQLVSLSAGIQYDFYADVAGVNYANGEANEDLGTISLSIGGNSVASISLGEGISQYGSLTGAYIPSQSGDELLELDFTRSYLPSPIDYIGNISFEPVPEPSVCSLIEVGLFGFGLIYRKLKS